MDWIKIYFSHQLFKIVFHFLYILMCLLLTAKILAHFGITYANPEKIEPSVILKFIFSGDVVIPLLSFLLAYLMFDNINKGLNYMIYRLTRGWTFKRLKERTPKMAFDFKWFQQIDGKYKKLQHYERFKAILQSFDDSPMNILGIAALANSVFLSSCLCLWLYPQGGALRSILLTTGVAFYGLHVLNLLFLRAINSDIEFFRGIRRQIDRDECKPLTFFRNTHRRRRPGIG